MDSMQSALLSHLRVKEEGLRTRLLTEETTHQYCSSLLPSLRSISLTFTYTPLSLFKFNMYAAMGRDNPWSGMMGVTDPSDDDQDTIKVGRRGLLHCFMNLCLTRLPCSRPTHIFLP